MRQATVYYKGQAAGTLMQQDEGGFVFRYLDAWYQATNRPAISLTLPKTQQAYQAAALFPCFFHMLPEGLNKQTLCRELRIDEADHFGLLLAVAQHDAIGALQVRQTQESA